MAVFIEEQPMRKVGFFRELPHGDPDGPSLRDNLDGIDSKVLVSLVDYLRSGALLAAIPRPGFDVLAPNAVGVPAPHLLTDGVWLWPADLAYYVDRYRVGVPFDFLRDAAAAKWTISVSERALLGLTAELMGNEAE